MIDAVAKDANKFWMDCPAVWAPFPLPPLRAWMKLMELVAAGAEEVVAMSGGGFLFAVIVNWRCFGD